MNHNVNKILEQKNIKPTAMRQLVLKILLKKQKAVSLLDIERQFENVERSTIFRILKIFQQNCIIHGVDDGTGAVKYAVCSHGCSCKFNDLHAHFLCNKCGDTTCLKDYPIPKQNLEEGYIFESANFVIKGICPACYI
ncbi:MAG: transcriptional repressor [Bacteroidetes bacterium HGW-Bacteroidetes-17]|jgi:Fur family ferric uptake transcriptional regulator|nr:MAG: transcriptional repressor [Bacteroidetes bacterium HGW-Bacteroidetes-17]